MDQTEYDVFISYSRKDYVDLNRHVIPGNALSKIKDMLTQNGLTYWFDEEGIYSGQEFTSVITKAIRTSKVFVFVSSKHSNSSAWTSNEIAIAKRLNKPIIPFCLDDSPYNDSVMMLIAALDYIDGRDQNTAYIIIIPIKKLEKRMRCQGMMSFKVIRHKNRQALRNIKDMHHGMKNS